MRTNIFVNLPVKDLDRSKSFFADLGYKFNQQFTDKNAACMVIDDNIYAMLLTEDFFQKLSTKKVLDAHKGAECATCLTVDDRNKVNAWANKAITLGATENKVPDMQIGEIMYSRSINDLDGHIWEILWMDPKAIQKS